MIFRWHLTMFFQRMCFLPKEVLYALPDRMRRAAMPYWKPLAPLMPTMMRRVCMWLSFVVAAIRFFRTAFRRPLGQGGMMNQAV